MKKQNKRKLEWLRQTVNMPRSIQELRTLFFYIKSLFVQVQVRSTRAISKKEYGIDSDPLIRSI